MPREYFKLYVYAFIALPLGFVGIPLYIHLPQFYSQTTTLSLSIIGVVLFITRLVDCVLDPFIGRLIDQRPMQNMFFFLLSSFLIFLGVTCLFFTPLFIADDGIIFIFSASIIVTYLAYSFLMLLIYAYGQKLILLYSSSEKVTAAREASLLASVIIASIIPTLFYDELNPFYSFYIFCLALFALLIVANFLYFKTYGKIQLEPNDKHIFSFKEFVHDSKLKWLFGLFFLNALAPAVTSTLFLFFVDDVLNAEKQSGFFLMLYFLGAIFSMPLWLFILKKSSKLVALVGSFLLAMSSFSLAALLQAGDANLYMLVCVTSGFALGGDLIILPSLLSDHLKAQNKSGGFEFGIWAFINKFTLALAALLTLPLLDVMGYTPGSANSNFVLQYTYALLPCVLKVLTLLYLIVGRKVFWERL